MSNQEIPIEVVSETTTTRTEELRNRLDVWLFSPASIVWNDFRTRVGLLIISVYLLMGTLGVLFYPAPKLNQGPILASPFVTAEFPLGTTATGQDLLALIIHSTPFMLKMIFAGAVFSSVVAAVVGTVSGYKGGSTDQILMSIADIALVIPGLPLVIVLSIAIQPENPYVVGVLLAINGWAGLSRSIRSEVVSLRNDAHVENSTIMGMSTSSVIVKDILPDLMPYILVNFMQAARNVIFASVGLYYLGLLPYSASNWGIILNNAQKAGAMTGFKSAHWVIFPMIAISVLVFGLIYFSQGLDRVFNPRIRARHARTVETDDRTDH